MPEVCQLSEKSPGSRVGGNQATAALFRWDSSERSMNEEPWLFCLRLGPARSGTSGRSSIGSSVEGKRVSISRYCMALMAGSSGASQASCEDDLGRLEEKAIVGWDDSKSRI